MSTVGEADDMLIAELAFGLLDVEEERSARARVTRDPDLTARLAIWEGLAIALLGRAEEAPRPSLWHEIDTRLPGNDDMTGDVGRAARWRTASIALGVIATLFGALALRSVTPSPALTPIAVPVKTRPVPAPLVAVLRAQDANAMVAVGFDPGSDRLTLAAEALDARTGSAELWAIPPDGPPHSLGLIAAGAPAWRVSHAASKLIVPGVTLAVTLEPHGGSPTGRPSGAPLLTGTVAVARAEDPPTT